ncbi:7292_t:CDS:1, partial [Acaulospora morrowiae]
MSSSDSDKQTHEVSQYQGPLTRLGIVTNKKLDIGDKPLPKPHRCYPHYKDIVNGLLSDPIEFINPFSIWLKCMRSEEG